MKEYIEILSLLIFPSMKLDVVGQTLFGRGKTEFRPDFYDENMTSS